MLKVRGGRRKRTRTGTRAAGARRAPASPPRRGARAAAAAARRPSPEGRPRGGSKRRDVQRGGCRTRRSVRANIKNGKKRSSSKCLDGPLAIPLTLSAPWWRLPLAPPRRRLPLAPPLPLTSAWGRRRTAQEQRRAHLAARPEHRRAHRPSRPQARLSAATFSGMPPNLTLLDAGVSRVLIGWPVCKQGGVRALWSSQRRLPAE